MSREAPERPRRLAWAGVAIGIGLGALLDGILFHDLLQWHHYVSARTSDLRANLVADGAFAAFGWSATLLGIFLLWRARRGFHAPGGGKLLAGAAIAGFAALNLVDVAVQHFLLGLHWLHPSGDLRYELAFSALNALLLLGGLRLARADASRRMLRVGRAAPR